MLLATTLLPTKSSETSEVSTKSETIISTSTNYMEEITTHIPTSSIESTQTSEVKTDVIATTSASIHKSSTMIETSQSKNITDFSTLSTLSEYSTFTSSLAFESIQTENQKTTPTSQISDETSAYSVTTSKKNDQTSEVSTSLSTITKPNILETMFASKTSTTTTTTIAITTLIKTTISEASTIYPKSTTDFIQTTIFTEPSASLKTSTSTNLIENLPLNFDKNKLTLISTLSAAALTLIFIGAAGIAFYINYKKNSKRVQPETHEMNQSFESNISELDKTDSFESSVNSIDETYN